MNKTVATRQPQSAKRRPIQGFQGLMRHPWFEDMFGQYLATNGDGELAEMMQVSMDVVETDNAFEVIVDLPGIKQNDVDIQLDNNTLTVRGERSEEKEEKDEEKKYHRVERFSGSFSRSIVLPDSVNEDEASADYKDGVLKIVIPKSEDSNHGKSRSNRRMEFTPVTQRN